MQGRLTDLAVGDLLQLCVENMFTGVLEIEQAGALYRLFWQEGLLVHALGPDGTGFDAVWPVFDLSEGEYRLQVGLRVPRRTIKDGTPEVLQRAAEIATAWATLRPTVRDRTDVPSLVESPPCVTVTITADDWTVLAFIDGQRALSTIATQSGLEELEVARRLAHLHGLGLVALDHISRPTVEARVPTPAAERSAPIDPTPRPASVRQRQSRRGSPLFGGIVANLTAAGQLALAPEPSAQPRMLSIEEIIRLVVTP